MKPKLYGAPWCGACCLMKKRLDEMKIEYDYIDIESDEETAKAQGIRSLPSFGFDGCLMTGLLPCDQIREYVDEFGK